jgi:hypothetical protein
MAMIVETFSLLGGPLHRLGRRVGLVRGGTNTVALGVALAVLPWTVLVALTLIEGLAGRVFALEVIGGHVRLLVAIPLFFLCESWLDPLAASFVSLIVRSGIVTEKAVPALESEIRRTGRWRDSWLAEAVCLLAAVLMSVIAPWLQLHGESAVFDPSRAPAGFTLTGLWWLVCLTFFRFLMLRWLWRLALWSHFLWKLSRLDLALVPTHPDRAGGLGFLEVVHMAFIPLVVEISAVQSASFAEDISAGKVAAASAYSLLAIILIVDAVLFLGPLFLFTWKLVTCRERGLEEYMELAGSYVKEFDRKWLRAAGGGEPLLGTADLQSLADLSNSVGIVRDMRWVPASRRLLVGIVVAALLPMVPLLLLKYPVAELIRMFFEGVTGL